jgi:hypothetical protein
MSAVTATGWPKCGEGDRRESVGCMFRHARGAGLPSPEYGRPCQARRLEEVDRRASSSSALDVRFHVVSRNEDRGSATRIACFFQRRILRNELPDLIDPPAFDCLEL